MSKKTETAEIQKPEIASVVVGIKGLSPVIMHRWSEKAKKEMLDKQMKKTVKKAAKSPEDQYEGSKYLLDDGRLGFPADAFKKAMIRGAKSLGLVMVDMKGGFFVHGEYSSKEGRELVELVGDVEPREDTVRIGSGVADIRYRPQVLNWTANLNISYNRSAVSFDQIVNMIEAAGYGVGIGDWRPERDGVFGRFEVAGTN